MRLPKLSFLKIKFLLFALIAIIVVKLLLIFSGGEFFKRSMNAAKSKEFVTASSILGWMDQSVEPCEDFFRFSCGKWGEILNPGFISSLGYNEFSQAYILDIDYSFKILTILESNPNPEDPIPINLAKMYFTSCKKYHNSNSDDFLDNLKNFIEKSLSELKIIDGDNGHKNVVNFEKTLVAIAGPGVLYNTIFIPYFALPNNENFTIVVDQPNFEEHKKYFGDSKMKTAYQNLIEKIWKFLYENEKGEIIAREIVDFETNLLAISDVEKDEGIEMSLCQIQNLTLNFEDFSWEIFINEIMKSTLVLFENDKNIPYNISSKNIVLVVNHKSYFSRLGTLLKSYLLKTPSIFEKYLRWRIIFTTGLYASHTIKNFISEFDPNATRSDDCLEQSKTFFGKAILYAYLKDNFPSHYKTKAQKIFENVRQTTFEILEEQEWIDERTKENAKSKIENIKSFIGYPDWFDGNNSKNELEFMYQNLKLSNPTNHFQNSLDIRKFAGIFMAILLTQGNNSFAENDYFMDEILTDHIKAAYIGNKNSIAIHVGYLKEPFFRPSLKNISYLNYGSLGYIAGHEIVHALLDENLLKNSNGTIDKYGEVTMKNWEDKINCFKNQYGNYSYQNLGLNVNGTNSLEENIADNGGLRVAFRAYRNFLKNNGPEVSSLPKLQKFTSEQLFFISFAQISCSSLTEKGIKTQIETDVHAPHQFRVKGAIYNSNEFAAAFNCPIKKDNCKFF